MEDFLALYKDICVYYKYSPMLEDKLNLESYRRITSKGKVVVYFTASWCGPCKKIKPVFNGFETESLSKMDDIVYLTIDVDVNDDIAAIMEIKAMPTFLFYINGKPEVKLTGANPIELRNCFAEFTSLNVDTNGKSPRDETGGKLPRTNSKRKD